MRARQKKGEQYYKRKNSFTIRANRCDDSTRSRQLAIRWTADYQLRIFQPSLILSSFLHNPMRVDPYAVSLPSMIVWQLIVATVHSFSHEWTTGTAETVQFHKAFY
jgi:hypothetical protein